MDSEGAIVGRRAKGGKVKATLIPRKSQDFCSTERAAEIAGTGHPRTWQADVEADSPGASGHGPWPTSARAVAPLRASSAANEPPGALRGCSWRPLAWDGREEAMSPARDASPPPSPSATAIAAHTRGAPAPSGHRVFSVNTQNVPRDRWICISLRHGRGRRQLGELARSPRAGPGAVCAQRSRPRCGRSGAPGPASPLLPPPQRGERRSQALASAPREQPGSSAGCPRQPRAPHGQDGRRNGWGPPGSATRAPWA